MAKKITKSSKLERIVELLKAKVDGLYDSYPQRNGKSSAAVEALAEEIAKIK